MVDRLARAREGKLSKKGSQMSFGPARFGHPLHLLNVPRNLSLPHVNTLELGLRGSEGGKEVEGKKNIEDRLPCLPRLLPYVVAST